MLFKIREMIAESGKLKVTDAVAYVMRKLPNADKKEVTNEAKEMMKVDKKSNLIFLKHNPKYPNNKTIDDMPLCKVEPLFDCNGMCGINDLSERSQTELQLNFEE